MRISLAAVVSFALAGVLPPPASAQNGDKPVLALQTGHAGSVTALAVTPDGRYLVSGGADRTARLWNLATGEFIRSFEGHESEVSAVAVSPDGKYLATVSPDETARLWELATGKELRQFANGRLTPVGQAQAAFSADGKTLTMSGGNAFNLWDVETGRSIGAITTESRRARTIVLTQDGRHTVVADWAMMLTLADQAGAPLMKTSLGEMDSVFAADVTADGRQLVVSNFSNDPALWDAAEGRKLLTFKGHTARVGTVAFGSDGKFLVTAAEDKTARIWDAESGRELHVIRNVNVPAVAMTPDGREAVVPGPGHSAVLLDLASGRIIRSFGESRPEPLELAFSPDGKKLAVGMSDHGIQIWNLDTGDLGPSLPSRETAWQLAFLPDGRTLASVGKKTADLWDLKSLKSVAAFATSSEETLSLLMKPGGQVLVAASKGHAARLWDLTQGKPAGKIEADDDILFIAISPDGTRLAANVADSIQLWNAATGEPGRRFGSKIESAVITFTPDGRELLSGGLEKGELQVWSADSGERVKSLEGDTSFIVSVAVSPDGRRALTMDLGARASLWDMASGTERRDRLIGIATPVVAAPGAFSPDGRRGATKSEDGTVRLWNADSGREICRFLSAGRDWVVVTPEGYFDGTPKGLKQIRWTVGLQSFPLEAFSEGYYVPGLLARLLAGETIVAAKLPKLSEGFALPPLVKIAAPANGAALESGSVDVSVQAADQGGGVDEIRLYQNGKAIGNETRGMKSAGRTQTFRVTLVDGDNVFKAVALSRDRIESNPDEITVVYKGPQKRAALHVLVVGVNQYKNSDLNLNYAQPDAQSISDFFRSAPDTLFSATTDRRLFDASATKAGILAELAALKATPPQDVVVIYLAGHGESIENTWYFVPYDLVYPEQEDEVKAKGLSSDEIRDAIRGMGAQKVLLMMDACKSGGALLAFAGRGVEDRKALSLLARAAGVHVVAASTKDQIAAEVKQIGHGVFTYTLLEGLKGGAAKNGVVTVAHLLSYIQDELPEISQKYKTQAQYPMVDSRGMDFPVTAAK